MTKFFKYMWLMAAAVALAPLTACDDDVETSSTNKNDYNSNFIYFYQPQEDYSSIAFKANGEFLSQLSDPVTLTPVKLTKRAGSNVNVTVGIDPTLVDEYNNANGTSYKLLQGATIVEPNMVIEAGTYQTAQPIQVSLADHSALINNTEDLILPIAITSATGGVTISKSSRTFLIFKYQADKISMVSQIIDVETEESDWASQLANLTVEDVIFAGWKADEQISVNMEIDNSLISTYNEEMGTSYVAMEGAQVNPAVIAQGESSSDIVIKCGDLTQIATGYVLPVKLTSVSGSGSAIDTDASVAYIVIREVVPSVFKASFSDSPITPGSDWSMTVNGEAGFEDEGDYYSWSQLFTDDDFFGFLYPDDVLVADLGSVQSLKGFYLQFYAWIYGVSELTKVETSVDGQTWKDWGSLSVGRNQSVTAKFNTKANARYVRITVGQPSFNSNYGTYITKVSFYAK